MSERSAEEITIGQISGGALQAMILFMYGKLEEIEDKLLLELFVASDKYQVIIHFDSTRYQMGH